MHFFGVLAYTVIYFVKSGETVESGITRYKKPKRKLEKAPKEDNRLPFRNAFVGRIFCAVVRENNFAVSIA